MNIKLIFILTISLFVKIVSYFVFPDHISGMFTSTRGTAVAGYTSALYSAATVQTARAAIGAWCTVATTC